MTISYYLLKLDPILIFVVVVSIGGFAAGFGTFLFRKFIRVKVLKSHNEVTGFLFTAIASFYALLLGFIVFVVWGEMIESNQNVSKEGSSAFALYRDIKFYPDTAASKPLLAVYLDFVYNVIDDEFPQMAKMKVSQKTLISFNEVFHEMERLDPKTPFQVELVGVMFKNLNELAAYRGLRTSAVNMEIPAPIWWPILLGAFVTIFCAMLLDIEYARMHIALNTLFGVFIGIFFFIIVLLDHPFSGEMGIKPDAYMQIFTMEGWTKDLTINK